MKLRLAALGLLLGFSLSWMGFADFAEVHKMFTLRDPRLLLTFAAGVMLTGVGIALCARGRRLQGRPIHKGTLAGGALFGLGWAVTGACPGAALVMLGEGQLAALATLGGMVVGTIAYRRAHARWFRWDTGSCAD
jgi:uncharacterized membrane protein YedE/YeeE